MRLDALRIGRARGGHPHVDGERGGHTPRSQQLHELILDGHRRGRRRRHREQRPRTHAGARTLHVDGDAVRRAVAVRGRRLEREQIVAGGLSQDALKRVRIGSDELQNRSGGGPRQPREAIPLDANVVR